MPSPRTAALRRPIPPATVRPAAQVQQRKLPGGDPLKEALAVLQLRAVPGSLAELVRHCTALHPDPRKSWGWPHVRAYQRLFDRVAEASGSAARSCSARR